MSKAKSSKRADYPIEAARRARWHAVEGLTTGLQYLDDEQRRDPRDAGRAFEALRAKVSDSLTELDGLQGVLSGSPDEPVPAHVMEAFARADEAFIDLIVTTYIEDQYPRLHGPQAEFRSAWANARADTPPG